MKEISHAREARECNEDDDLRPDELSRMKMRKGRGNWMKATPGRQVDAD